MTRAILFLMMAMGMVLAQWPGSVAAQENYRLRPGDTLRIEVLEDSSLNRSVLIAPDGRVGLPLAGNVRAGGQTLEAVQSALLERLAPNFAAPPTVFVSLERPREPREVPEKRLAIYVIGEARNPGRIEVSDGTTVLQFFGQMGGFTNFAATRRIQLRRGHSQWVIDYRAIEAGKSNMAGITLAEGDVIIIPQRRLFE